jgi:uncharacterized protein DUF4129
LQNLSKVLLFLLFILLFSTLAAPVLASDDSNSGGTTPIPSLAPTQYVPNENATNTLTAIDQLSQGVNDTTYKSLVDQLKSDVQTGNNTDETQTIRELQQHVSSSQGTGISQSLIDQLKNDFQTGNSADAQRLIQDLQGYASSSQGSGITQSLLDRLRNDAQSGNNADAQRLLQNLQSNVGTSQGSGISQSLLDQLKNDAQSGNSFDAQRLLQDLQGYAASTQGNGISQGFLDQLKNDVQSGNSDDAKQLLQDLQGYAASSQGSGISQSLIDQLKNDIQTGNNSDAQQLVQQLQSDVGSSQGSGISPTLKDLTQSLTMGQNGLSVDPSILKSLIGDPNQDGVPTGLTGMNPVQAAGDLSSLSNLMKGIDPSQALSLAQDSQQLQDVVSALGGGTGGTGPIPSPPPININGLTGGSNPVSKLPSVPLRVGGGFQLASMNPIIIGPVIIAILGLAILIWKRSALARWAKRITPSTPKKLGRLEKPDAGLDLRSPRDLVIYYFRKAIAAMQRRGVPREIFETHREFADKVSPRPEGQPVGHVSTLYEKAMFSGREVTETDAEEAKENSLLVEKTPSKTRSDTTIERTGFP